MTSTTPPAGSIPSSAIDVALDPLAQADSIRLALPDDLQEPFDRMAKALRAYQQAGGDRYVECRVTGWRCDPWETCATHYQRFYTHEKCHDPILCAMADMDALTADSKTVYWVDGPYLEVRDAIVTEWSPLVGGS